MISNTIKNSIIDGLIAIDIIFLVTNLVIILSFAVFLIFSINKNLSKNKKSLYLIICASAWAFLQVAEFSRGQAFFKCIILPTISFSLSLIFYAILLLVNGKNIKIKKEHKTLIDKLDQQIKQEVENSLSLKECSPDEILPKQMLEFKNNCLEKPFNVGKPKKVENLVCQEKDAPKPTKENSEVDFSHVKNVISRLEYYTLTQLEKRQVEDLKRYVLEAERGNFDRDLKGKINDGLGWLLKIMSKYGV